MAIVKKCAGVVMLILLLISTAFAMSACSVSFTSKSPSDGIFYCNELKMAIDFSLMKKTNENTRRYSNDGSYILCSTLRDYGSGIWICSLDQETWYFGGNFKYENDIFYVTERETGIEYAFVRVPEWP